MGDLWGKNEKEVIKNVEWDYNTYYNRTNSIGSYSVTTLHFTTNANSYIVYNGAANLSEGDTIIIKKNFFGKGIYYYKENWNYKYELNISRMYYIILFFTAISLIFSCFIKKEINIYIIIISIINVFSIITYFFYKM
jgi:hypothetical protein